MILRRTPDLRSAGLCLGFSLALTGVVAAQDDTAIPSDARETSGEVEESVPSVFGSGLSLSPERVFRGEESVMDYLWNLPVLIDNPEGRVIQELQLTGLYQVQHYNVSASQGSASGTETRRFRLGMRTRFFEDFTFQFAFNRDGEESTFDSDNLHSMWLAWRRNERFGLKVGQQKPLWTQEWSESSRTMPIFERSLLVNQLHPPFSIGLYASGKLESWAYGIGYFSGDIESGFDSGAGSFLLVNLGHEFVRAPAWLEEARWRFDYLWNGNANQVDGDTPYRHGFATGVSGRAGPWILTSDLIYARGTGSVGNLFGLTMIPSYDLIPEKLQLVLRLQLAASSKDSLQLQNRYEAAIADPFGLRLGDQMGERYGAIYGGVNWFLYGNKLKLMTGLEYSRMNDKEGDGGDFDGWTFFAGMRMYF